MCGRAPWELRSSYVAFEVILFVSFLSSFFDVVFISSRSLLGSILNSQTDPPTLKNCDFLVALDALFFVFFLSSFFDVVFYLLPEPLGVDFELPN